MHNYKPSRSYTRYKLPPPMLYIYNSYGWKYKQIFLVFTYYRALNNKLFFFEN